MHLKILRQYRAKRVRDLCGISLKILALTLVLASILTISISASASVDAYVNVDPGETVNVRDWPDGNIVFTLPRGTHVYIVSTVSNKWDKVSVLGHSGEYYIMSQFLSQTQPTANWIAWYGSTTLKFAPSVYNTYVVNLQKDLRSAGYTSITNADGYFGSITETAVNLSTEHRSYCGWQGWRQH